MLYTTLINLHPCLCLKVQFDITFPALPCSILSLDAMDISGEQHLDVVCITRNHNLLLLFFWLIRHHSSMLMNMQSTILMSFDWFLGKFTRAMSKNVMYILQKHDIFKKRLDSQGNVIEARQDGIGAPKVCNTLLLKISVGNHTVILSCVGLSFF